MIIFIYKITNIINNKMYIGQTIRPVKDRFHRHITDATNNILDTHLARAIRKYGAENFKIETIDVANNETELTLKENYWINYYNSIDSNIGYNETNALYKCGGNTYMSKTVSELQKIKDKIRKTKMGSNNPNAKSIKCYNVITNEELYFDTVKDCKEHFNEKNHRFITTRTNKKVLGLYKNQWMIAYANKDYGYYKRERFKTGIKMIVTNVDNGNIDFVESIAQASRKYGINKNLIHKHKKEKENNFIINNLQFTILN